MTSVFSFFVFKLKKNKKTNGSSIDTGAVSSFWALLILMSLLLLRSPSVFVAVLAPGAAAAVVITVLCLSVFKSQCVDAQRR